MNQQETISTLRDERERLSTYLNELPDSSWTKPSLCEGWSVRDVVSHLVGNCANVLNQNLDDIGKPEYNDRQIEERKAKSTQELLEEWAHVGPGCEALYEAMPPEMWDMDMGGVIGTIGNGVLRQVEDLWVHAQDIRIALGADPSAGPGLQGSLDLIAIEIAPLLRKHASEVGTLVLSLGGFEMSIAGAGTETVKVTGDPVAFALVATGRRPLDAAQAEGRLAIEGNLPNPDRVFHIYGPEFSERA